MTVSLNNDLITASSGTLTLEEGGKQIKIKTDQRIYTDNYMTSGTYVFTKGVKIPVGYFAARRTSSSNSTFLFDIATGTIGSIVNGTAEVALTEYYSQLSKILTDTAVSCHYSISGCQSQLDPTTTSGLTEKTYYLTNKGFSKSAYNINDHAPIVRTSDEQIPNLNNGYINGQIIGSSIQFAVSSSNYNFIVLMVEI